MDEDRPVSSVYQYQAELDDEYEPLEEERISRPRIRGARDVRPTRTDEYEDEAPRRYRRDETSESPRRPSNRAGSAERLGQEDRLRKRRPRPETRPIQSTEENDWDYPQQQDTSEDWEMTSRRSKSPRRSTNGPSSRRENLESEVSSRPRKRRPPQDDAAYSQDRGVSPSEYVDYKPIQPDEERDNSANFDEL